MRLFFAIELPDEVRSALASTQPSSSAASDYRWVEPHLLHITLVFLGEQTESALAPLTVCGADAANACPPARLQVGNLSSFGPARAPRVLLAELGGNVPALRRLQATLANALQHAGFAFEERAFTPHITLARRRKSTRAPIGFPWPPHHLSPHLDMPMDQLVLMHSVLSRSGPTYTPLESFRLNSALGQA